MQTKPPSQIHKENIFVSTLRKSLEKGFYEDAKKELAPIPYAVRNRTLFLFCKYYTVVFHVISCITAFFGVYIIAKITGGLQYADTETRLPIWVLYTLAGLTTFLLSMLLIWLEILKNNQANGVFKALAIGETVKTVNVAGLLVATILNIAVSAFGGAALSYQTSDRSLHLDKVYTMQKDSVQNNIALQISTYDKTISYYEDLRKARQKRSKQWGLEKSEVALLDKAISQKAKLQDLAETKLSTLQGLHKNSILQNGETERKNGVLSALAMLSLELLALWCYYYRYQYYKFCEIEEANFNILATENVDTVSVPNITVSVDNKATETVLQAIAEQLANLKPNVQPITPYANRLRVNIPYNKENSSPIGFPVPKTVETPTVETPITPTVRPLYVSGKGYYISCKNCGVQVWKKSPSAVFCSDKCRLEHHLKNKS
jgi:hypothetical protein